MEWVTWKPLEKELETFKAFLRQLNLRSKKYWIKRFHYSKFEFFLAIPSYSSSKFFFYHAFWWSTKYDFQEIRSFYWEFENFFGFVQDLKHASNFSILHLKVYLKRTTILRSTPHSFTQFISYRFQSNFFYLPSLLLQE